MLFYQSYLAVSSSSLYSCIPSQTFFEIELCAPKITSTDVIHNLQQQQNVALEKYQISLGIGRYLILKDSDWDQSQENLMGTSLFQVL